MRKFTYPFISIISIYCGVSALAQNADLDQLDDRLTRLEERSSAEAVSSDGVSGEHVMRLQNRLNALEVQNQQLVGKIEELGHALDQMNKKMDHLSADLEFYAQKSKERPKLTAEGVSPLGDEAVLQSKQVEDHVLPEAEPQDIYSKAIVAIKEGRYAEARQQLGLVLKHHPKNILAGNAHYWMGVTYFIEGNYDKALVIFADGYKKYKNSSKAPENLLKLAKTFHVLKKNEEACATLKQLENEFKPLSALIKKESEKLKKEVCKG